MAGKYHTELSQETLRDSARYTSTQWTRAQRETVPTLDLLETHGEARTHFSATARSPLAENRGRQGGQRTTRPIARLDRHHI